MIIMEAFIDVLLNEALMDGQPFKIVAILTVINEMELNLANIMSSYFNQLSLWYLQSIVSYGTCYLSINITITLTQLL